MKFSSQLSTWYKNHKRDLPWRVKPLHPYKVFVSEMMLHQTTVNSVIPYFQRFMTRFPDLESLAHASLHDVMLLWQGLGYYRRAQYLLQASQKLWEHVSQKSSWPITQEEWKHYPGVGEYSAASISAIAFSQKSAAVDANVRRIMSRYYGINDEKSIREHAFSSLPEEGTSDYTQALMDLGALVCRPKQPLCESCPVKEDCYAYTHDRIEDFPLVFKKKQERQYAHMFLWRHSDGRVLIQQEEKKLLQHLWRFPCTVWSCEDSSCPIQNVQFCGTIKHVFTHIKLTIHLWEGLWDANNKKQPPLSRWIKWEELNQWPLSRLMQKAIAIFLQKQPTML